MVTNQNLMNLHKEKKVVAIGGGHGLGRVLAALRDFGENATGIVTTTDNGGSTGRIRHCQGGIAWGDMRNCINQLITTPSIASMMFEHRFRGQGELDGHNLGNLMLTALDNLSVRPLDAIGLIRTMLNVDVNIVPMSEYPADLTALTTDGQMVTGETSVDQLDTPLTRIDISPQVPATHEAIAAIRATNAIILGPGSFLTSVMPPLLLSEIGKAIARNTSAKLIYIDNLSPESGPAGQMDLNEKLTWCSRACEGRPIDVVLGGENLRDHDEESFPHKETRLVIRELASPNKAWRHEREKLKLALEEQLMSDETGKRLSA